MLPLASIFAKRQVTFMGVGVSMSVAHDALLLAKYGADVVVTDARPRDALPTGVTDALEHTAVKCVWGGYHLQDFRGKELILIHPGIPRTSRYIEEARSWGAGIDTLQSLFMRVAPIRCLGVTGSYGKTTIALLLGDMLRAAGFSVTSVTRECEGGVLAGLEQVTERSVGVFELDSFACQGFGEQSLQHEAVRQGPHAPYVTVLTSLTSEQLAYYDGDTAAYWNDIAKSFIHQGPDDTLVLGRQAEDPYALYKYRVRSKVVLADEQDVPKEWTKKLCGEHNVYNIGLAVAAARVFDVPFTTIHSVASSFLPPQGVLSLSDTVSGVPYYNDEQGMTPFATTTALRALDPRGAGTIVLILGGEDHHLDFSLLAPAITKHCKHLVLLPGSGTDRIVQQLHFTVGFVTHAATIREAVSTAYHHTHHTDTVLFSPAFSLSMPCGAARREFELAVKSL